jgi:transposase
MDYLQATKASKHTAAILVAIELSKTRWLLALYDPTSDKISRRDLDGGDVGALIEIIERRRVSVQAHTGDAIEVECVFEAGYDGFWLQRRLAQAGIACRVMDPASLKVDRRARRVKTDRVDAESLLCALQAWRRGDRQACKFVRIPTIEEEDARRPHRELARLTKERVGHVNRIKGLLALHGIRDYQPLRRDRREALAALRTGCSQGLPEHCRGEVERELARLELVLEHVEEVEAAMACPVREAVTQSPARDVDSAAEALTKLKCVGRETAAVLAREVLCRDFRDRRSIAAFAGLTPSPYSSGRLQHMIRESARPATPLCVRDSCNWRGAGSDSRPTAMSLLGSLRGRMEAGNAAGGSQSWRSRASYSSPCGATPRKDWCRTAPN